MEKKFEYGTWYPISEYDESAGEVVLAYTGGYYRKLRLVVVRKYKDESYSFWDVSTDIEIEEFPDKFALIPELEK